MLDIKKKIVQREYRPSYIFRIPIRCIAILFACKAKHPLFFSAVNPGVKSGGFMDEPKSFVYELLKNGRFPKSIQVSFPFDLEHVVSQIKNSLLTYPLVIKPDGDSVMGNNVFIIDNQNKRSSIVPHLTHGSYLIQEYIDGDEYSVHYYRYPWEEKGSILGITKKIYPFVVGNGKDTLFELLSGHDRYKRYIKLFQEKYAVDMDEVIENGATKQIAKIGNHSKGSLFLDWSHHTTKQLEEVFDTVFEANAGIYLFRLDIKTPSRDELLKGNFVVLESNNGVFAEPTYMYDPDYKIVNAYKNIYDVWYHSYKIATYNHSEGKVGYLSLSQGLKKLYQFFTT